MTPNSRESDELILQMLALREKGLTAPQIGLLLGFTASYVRSITSRCMKASA
jgi:hypothetical protein